MRVLFLTHRLPYAANRGDRIRALHLLKHLKTFADVDLVSFVHDDEEAAHVSELRDLASTVTVVRLNHFRGYAKAVAALPSGRSLTHAMLDSPEVGRACARLIKQAAPDVVLAYCSGMARFALEPPLATIPMVLDMVDVDSEKWRVLGTTAAIPARWVYAREARLMAAFETRVARTARSVLVVNDRERASLLRLAPGANVHVVPNGIAVDEFRRPSSASEETRVVFCGVMNYEPNEEGARWFARAVWPIVRAQRPEARLSLVGSRPTAAVRRLAIADPTIEVTGAVPDVQPYLWRSAVSIAPLFLSRGVQNKVLEAVAAGLPSVVTAAVQAGLPAEVAPACVMADDAGDFAAAVVDLLSRSSEERRRLAARANLQAITWASQLGSLRAILEGAARQNRLQQRVAPC